MGDDFAFTEKGLNHWEEMLFSSHKQNQKPTWWMNLHHVQGFFLHSVSISDHCHLKSDSIHYFFSLSVSSVFPIPQTYLYENSKILKSLWNCTLLPPYSLPSVAMGLSFSSKPRFLKMLGIVVISIFLVLFTSYPIPMKILTYSTESTFKLFK